MWWNQKQALKSIHVRGSGLLACRYYRLIFMSQSHTIVETTSTFYGTVLPYKRRGRRRSFMDLTPSYPGRMFQEPMPPYTH